MDALNLIIALVLYGILEAVLRIGVFAYFAGWKHVSWKLASPHISMLVSPSYWLARNCKLINPPGFKRVALRARLIANYNLWNLLLSTIIFVAVAATEHEGYGPFGISVALIVWRSISRSFEIAIAFGIDITTSRNASKLPNEARMKLALRSYLEIFLFSAALYSVTSLKSENISVSVLASLYVSTLTNVSYAADKLQIANLFFLQVFATLSLIVLSIAGYLGRVKRSR
ncbi:hypothetical protein [Variovorax rhizosphaerae]|uniref:Uncharacterized protein n=1 Tax=Variovorax rhizosphaerae TaxID=1836200 RepID=A0ABU8WI32_9BURK